MKFNARPWLILPALLWGCGEIAADALEGLGSDATLSDSEVAADVDPGSRTDDGAITDADRSGDGGRLVDGGRTGPDGGPPRLDAGRPPPPDGGRPQRDGGRPGIDAGQATPCTELGMCCNEGGPNFQMTCNRASASGNDAVCQRVLDAARDRGLCGGAVDGGPPPPQDGGRPPPQDGGPPPPLDGGRPPPLDGGRPPPGDGGLASDATVGPQCMELAACCPTLPQQAQTTCDQAVATGREQACGRQLSLARQFGFCVAPDAGP